MTNQENQPHILAVFNDDGIGASIHRTYHEALDSLEELINELDEGYYSTQPNCPKDRMERIYWISQQIDNDTCLVWSIEPTTIPDTGMPPPNYCPDCGSDQIQVTTSATEPTVWACLDCLEKD